MNLLVLIWRTVTRSNARIERRLAHLEQQGAQANAKLDLILEQLTTGPLDHFEFDVQVEGEQAIEGALEVTLTNSQRAQLSIRPVDRKNHPAPLDGVPVWATSDPTVATVTPGILDNDGNIVADPDPQGLKAVLEGVSEGTGRITVTGDARLGDETKPITGVLEVIVTAGEAVTVVIDAAAPIEIP